MRALAKIEKILKLAFRIGVHWMPVKKHCVYVYNILDGYNDSVKYILLELHNRHPDYLYIWELPQDSRNEELPEWVVQTRRYSWTACYYQTRAELVLDSYIGLRSRYCDDLGKACMLRAYFQLLKCKGQINLSTFHGTPFKFIGSDRADKTFADSIFLTSCNFFVCGNELERTVYSRVYRSDYEVLMLGKANTDPLFDRDMNEIRQLKEKLDLPKNKKIILYAPTYRDWSLCNGGLNQLRQIDIPAILKAMKNKFGGEWVFGLRVHHYVLDGIRKSGLLDEYKDMLYDCNRGDDMAEYMCSCDAIISDYSSLLVDALLTTKPCFIYANDYDEYLEKRGGLYIDLHRFPYGVQRTADELLQAILNYDEQHVDIVRKALLHEIGNLNDGHAAERITDYIDQKILRDAK